ncbi:hypothetical protein POM88_027644 [Heracleum sosnowskyi]|uniref:beta-glucosidase n=1 Tax=Heracleum sosnowskyi TaxID=360622 RepID=A0AAD8I8S5_9APIA|nr:hypothetical protein POM88_027644 [Heracleum sosnowskyi]
MNRVNNDPELFSCGDVLKVVNKAESNFGSLVLSLQAIWGKEWWRDGVCTGQNQALQDAGAVVPTSYEASNHAEAVLIMSEEICLNQIHRGEVKTDEEPEHGEFLSGKITEVPSGDGQTLMETVSVDVLQEDNEIYVTRNLTLDPVLVKKIGAATALEARATGIPYVFTPCIAVCRDPRWGRCYESYSEDHKIVQAMTEIIPGLQGDIPYNSRKGVPFSCWTTRSELTEVVANFDCDLSMLLLSTKDEAKIQEDGGEIVQACNLASRFFTFGKLERGG